MYLTLILIWHRRFIHIRMSSVICVHSVSLLKKVGIFFITRHCFFTYTGSLPFTEIMLLKKPTNGKTIAGEVKALQGSGIRETKEKTWY
jgi:hypothetical protein